MTRRVHSLRRHDGSRHLLTNIRRCRPDERDAILAIVNAAAARYRGVIPGDCWHEPYMTAEQLARDVAAGVTFWGYEDPEHEAGELRGVMGIQPVRDVVLVRHAYVRPDSQGRGIGGALLDHLEALDGVAGRPILIGTWADATWAIAFYRAHGYALVPPADAAALLARYWSGVSARQAEVSVVLAKGRAT
ncbi:MAG TPA: GNAT family N-acetyltransferase [Gemmatimonadaceae bacterium]|nr:GNAT family N-acetyltransferase [Gemmatimonadaceae bacterium]